MRENKLQRSVFYDSGRTRWRVVSTVVSTVAVALTILAGITIVSILVSPALPSLGLKAIGVLPHAEHLALNPSALKSPERVDPRSLRRRAIASQLDTDESTAKRLIQQRPPRSQRTIAAHDAEIQGMHPAGFTGTGVVAPSVITTSPPGYRSQLIGFYVNWDDASLLSLKEHLSQFDLVVPEWLHVVGPNAAVTPDDALQEALTLHYIRTHRPGLPVMPLVNNYDQTKQAWDSADLVRVLHTAAGRTSLANRLLTYIQSQGLAGIDIDFENLPPTSRNDLVAFMQQVSGVFHTKGLRVSEAVPAADPAYDYHRLAAASDFVMVMLYDQHSAGTAAGSVASIGWFKTVLAQRAAQIPASKLVVGIGSYGYDWVAGKPTQPVTFIQALTTAETMGGTLTLDPISLNPHYSYADQKGTPHQVWLLDAVSAYDELVAAHSLHPMGYALWRLGSEDPSIWGVLAGRDNPTAATARTMRVIDPSQMVAYEGSGEILRVTAKPTVGSRSISYDPSNGLVTAESTVRLASPYVLTQWGGGASKEVALTFDDGPDPYWTPKILDVLDLNNVPATFFIIGANGNSAPDVLRREYRIGEEIGNHTFTHPDIAVIPSDQLKWQLDATQRLLESVVGVRTVLFRPPYGEDSQPDTPRQVAPLLETGRLGYYTIGMNVDPNDWARPGTQQIIDRTVAQVEQGRGHIVLLHDGGGDRSETLAALPSIIERLHADGYTFVTVSKLLGLPRSTVMPPVPAKDHFFATIDSASFGLIDWLNVALYWVFMVGIVLGIGRLVLVGALALIERARRHRALGHAETPAFHPLTSVIVPAYNEEKVIVSSVRSLLASTYDDIEVIVVDDGSTDGTYRTAVETFASDSRVRVFTKPNSGKADTLNHGIARAHGEIIIGMDADTIFRPDAIAKLVRHFGDPRVGAVAGNAKVGNRVNLITRWQALEYITNQNLDRRAFDLLNCITVVPGAIGAWRKDLIVDAGGFTSDTLAEDAELTLRVLEHGYRIRYEDAAIADTEAPDTVRGLVRQRTRWIFGTMQAYWKHRRDLFNPKRGALGMVAMPNAIIFQILFQLLSPVMDLVMALSIVSIFEQRAQSPIDWSPAGFEHILFYYALFLALDVAASAIAFALEPDGEQWSLLGSLLLQRFFYRQLLYVVAWRSLVNAVRGTIVGWSHAERKATVSTAD